MKRVILTFGVFLTVFFIFIGPASADDSGQTASSAVPTASAPSGAAAADQAHPNQQKVEALKRLKAENPAEYRRVIKARKAAVRKKLQELKKTDPQKFQEIRQRIIRQRRERLERMKKQDPEKFQQLMQKKLEKIEEIRRTDPERYERFIRKHPGLAGTGPSAATPAAAKNAAASTAVPASQNR